MVLPLEQQTHIKVKVVQDWIPDTITGRKEIPIGCSVRTFYRRFKEKIFDETNLAHEGKKKTQWAARKPRKTGLQAEYR